MSRYKRPRDADPWAKVEMQVLGHLRDIRDEDAAIPTLNIAKAVFGPHATCKDVNALLYSLRRRGLVDKVCMANGSKPRWYSKCEEDPKDDSGESSERTAGQGEEEMILYMAQDRPVHTYHII